MTKVKRTETLRSSFSLDGLRIFLEYDQDRNEFRLATRWRWLSKFDNVHDACDAFEALELIEGDEIRAATLIKKEIARVPRHRFGNAGRDMRRINYLINCVERRLAGLRPIRTGSKGAVECWIPA